MQDYYTYLSLAVAVLGTLVAIFGEAYASEKNRKIVAVISGLLSVVGFAFSFFLTQQSSQESEYTKNQLDVTRKNTDLLKKTLDSSNQQMINIRNTAQYLTKQLDTASKTLMLSSDVNTKSIGRQLSKTSDSLSGISKQTERIIANVQANITSVEKTEKNIDLYVKQLDDFSSELEDKIGNLDEQSSLIISLLETNDSLQRLFDNKLQNIKDSLQISFQREIGELKKEIKALNIVPPAKDSL